MSLSTRARSVLVRVCLAPAVAGALVFSAACTDVSPPDDEQQQEQRDDNGGDRDGGDDRDEGDDEGDDD